ncbi:MAG: ribosomal protein S18 acetylase RimI-like enzyme [Arcticibacterium sp.]|jgi:ribosomal protein S18 acetylase RimI-like enzyme
MSTILKASQKDAETISILAKKTFLESHSHSANPSDIDTYIQKHYSLEAIRENLSVETHIYFLIYHGTEPAGYSKIILNTPFQGHKNSLSTKLDRIYILEKHYGFGLGKDLLDFNIDLAKSKCQSEIWLYTWKENQRAIAFYRKVGFQIIGSHDFKISETHVNPNHLMLLKF